MLLKSAASQAQQSPAPDRQAFPLRQLAKLSLRLRSKARLRLLQSLLVLPRLVDARRQKAKNSRQFRLLVQERHLLHGVS
jgi:hypothetical protein